MKKVTLRSFALAASLILSAGCNQTETSTSATESSLDSSSFSASKIALDVATFDEVAPYVSECQGHKLCVEVCHRPPGNPENSKTMRLPLAATAAHLNHGGSHAEKDYLGPCVAEDSGGDGSGGEDGSDDGSGDSGEDPGDGGDTSGGDDGSGGGDDTVPAWCATYQHIDSDCDGLIDESGEPLF